MAPSVPPHVEGFVNWETENTGAAGSDKDTEAGSELQIPLLIVITE